MITIDKVSCLLLDKRYDERYRISDMVWENLGLETNFFIVGDGQRLDKKLYSRIDVSLPANIPNVTYPPFVQRPNSYNAFLSFKEIVKQAQTEKKDNLLILEDDALFTDNFMNLYKEASTDLLNYDSWWAMLYLGAHHSRPVKRISNCLVQMTGSGCWHSVLLNQRSFQAILDLPITDPIDEMVGRLLHSAMRCYAVYPSISLQKTGFSFCENSNVDYNSVIMKEPKFV